MSPACGRAGKSCGILKEAQVHADDDGHRRAQDFGAIVFEGALGQPLLGRRRSDEDEASGIAVDAGRTEAGQAVQFPEGHLRQRLGAPGVMTSGGLEHLVECGLRQRAHFISSALGGWILASPATTIA